MELESAVLACTLTPEAANVAAIRYGNGDVTASRVERHASRRCEELNACELERPNCDGMGGPPRRLPSRR